MRRSHGRNRDGLEIARRARRLRAPPVRGAHRIGGGAVPAHGDARPLSFSHHPGSGGKPRDILSSRRLDFAFARFALFLPTMPATKSIAVLGAGVTGLTAAHRLVQGGHRVRVFERSGRIGGAIRTERTDGWLVESGPNTLLSGKPGLAALLDELGLADERVDATPTAKQRFIVRGGRLVPAPLSPPAFLTSRLFSPFAKARVLAEFLVRPRGRATDLSLASFIRAHFGQEFVDYALNPFVAGVYAGDPQQLSARHAFPQLWELERRQGSLLRGQIALARARRARGEAAPVVFSFRHGLQTLIDALAARLPAGALTLNAGIETLMPGEPWNIVWQDAAGTRTESFDAVVAAVPAPALGQLRFGSLGERPLVALGAMEQPPVASLFLGFRREQVAHPLDGLGLLVPAVESRNVLGILFSSTLFPGRAPAGHVALTLLAGGMRQPALAALSAPELFARVRSDLADLLGVTGEPVFLRHTAWPRAIPQYQLGHEKFLAAMAECEAGHPRLFIGGQARDGVAVTACIAAGEKLAQRAAEAS
mgnify:FL=1